MHNILYQQSSRHYSTHHRYTRTVSSSDTRVTCTNRQPSCAYAVLHFHNTSQAKLHEQQQYTERACESLRWLDEESGSWRVIIAGKTSDNGEYWPCCQRWRVMTLSGWSVDHGKTLNDSGLHYVTIRSMTHSLSHRVIHISKLPQCHNHISR